VAFEKRRDHAPEGSIPDVLQMFSSEVRFYREIAPVVGVRVPSCVVAEDSPAGTRLVLEDLSAWTPGADPAWVARELAALHRRWEGAAGGRWPWLRPVGAAADLIGARYDETWPRLAARVDLPSEVRRLGEALVGGVADAERAEAEAGPLTLCQGDAHVRNVFTSPDGDTIAFVDWEDVRCAPGLTDLAWLLVSSVDAERWDEVIASYGGTTDDLPVVLPSAAAQGFLAFAGEGDGDPAWIGRARIGSGAP
jgi:hypothetical protein